MPARRAWWWNSPNQKKNALGTSYGRPVGGTEPSAFVDEGAETVRPKHLEKVREGEEEKEEEETNEMLFHHKPRPAAEGPAPVSPNVLIEYIFFLVMLVKRHGCTPA